MATAAPKWLTFLLLAATLPVCGQWPCDALHALRAGFMCHSTFHQAEDTEKLTIELASSASGDCKTLIDAHRWVSLARSADFGFNPATKLQRLNAGLKGLDQLIVERPDLLEIQALRLSITGTAPRFLGVDDDWETDLAALQRLLANAHWKNAPLYSEWMRDLAKQIQQERT